MSNDLPTNRPIGWWLKEADARIDAAFDVALSGTGVDRRGWQVLASARRGESTRGGLTAALGSFDPPDEVERVIDRYVSRGWLAQSGDLIRLTTVGAEEHEALVPVVAEVRRTVAEALSPKEYAVLTGLLARLAQALTPAP